MTKEDLQQLSELMDAKMEKQKTDILREISANMEQQKADILKESAANMEQQKADILKESAANMEKQKMEILKESATNMRVILEAYVEPKFELLAEKIDLMSEKLAPMEAFEDQEERLDILEAVVKQHSREIVELKKAQ